MIKMLKFRTHNCKYLHLIYTSNISGPLFHTTKNPVLPNLGSGETHSQPDYLQCLRPVVMPVSDIPTLAGDPRCPVQQDHGIKPEVVEKWNQTPKQDIYKEWSKYSVFY